MSYLLLKWLHVVIADWLFTACWLPVVWLH